jgi:hypothetical protein
MKEEIDSKRQLRTQHKETTDHLTSGCPILVKNEYLMRHDNVYAHLHYSICKALDIKTTDIWYTLSPTPVHERVTANRPDVIIKNKKRTIHTDRCGNTCRQICHAKGSREETKIRVFMYRDTTHVEHEMYDYPSNNWSHQNSNKRFKENLEAIPEKHSIQKTAILRSHMIQKVLQAEP